MPLWFGNDFQIPTSKLTKFTNPRELLRSRSETPLVLHSWFYGSPDIMLFGFHVPRNAERTRYSKIAASHHSLKCKFNRLRVYSRLYTELFITTSKWICCCSLFHIYIHEAFAVYLNCKLDWNETHLSHRPVFTFNEQ